MGGWVVAQGLYFNVDSVTNVIQNFYYMNNNQYVDILLPAGERLSTSDNSSYSTNIFTNNNFTGDGVAILSVIPYFNQIFSTPSKLFFFIFPLPFQTKNSFIIILLAQMMETIITTKHIIFHLVLNPSQDFRLFLQ
jgi:hypothetical protein